MNTSGMHVTASWAQLLLQCLQMWVRLHVRMVEATSFIVAELFFRTVHFKGFVGIDLNTRKTL